MQKLGIVICLFLFGSAVGIVLVYKPEPLPLPSSVVTLSQPPRTGDVPKALPSPSASLPVPKSVKEVKSPQEVIPAPASISASLNASPKTEEPATAPATAQAASSKSTLPHPASDLYATYGNTLPSSLPDVPHTAPVPPQSVPATPVPELP